LKLGDAPAEVINGVVTYKAEPSAEHADAQLGLGSFLRQHFHRAPGRGGPGGWWILTELDVELEEHEVYRPDVAGWRRDCTPERPRGRPVAIRPDWTCEILSESNAATDQVDKFRVYASNAVPFYWMGDPARRILTVYRLEGASYAVALQAKLGEIVHAPPFDAVPGEDPD
jgi:Uma2 family endonuclease